MILVTVGTQLPFDRLIQMADEIAPELDEPIVAQVGKSRYRPKHIERLASVAPREFERYVQDARVIVAHAGIGTVLKAYKLAKPIVLVPRLARLKEHRNDHQLATVGELKSLQGISIAETVDELRALLRAPLEPAVATPDMLERRQQLIGSVAGQIAAWSAPAR